MGRSFRAIPLCLAGAAAFVALAGCTTLLGTFDVGPSGAPDGSGDASVTPNAADGSSPPAPDVAAPDAGLPDADVPDAPAEACVPETDAALCAKLGKSCDGIIANDACGSSRTVASCGTCASPQTCGAQTPNVCGCRPEKDAELCARLGKNCQGVTAPDNCGLSRTVASCGACSQGQTCGAHVPNVCGSPVCVAESDDAFCARFGKTCEALAGTDNCGVARSVTSCGSCKLPQTCGALTPGVCGCVPESDASFCARSGRTCGAHAGPDNCGVTRSVASCGGCTGASNTCSTAGTCTCNGNAACAGGQTCCGSGCVDTARDPANCGQCGRSCGPGGGWSCAASRCSCAPAGPRSQTDLCSDNVTCVHIHNDRNCTRCGDACRGQQICCSTLALTDYACGTRSLTCR